MTQATSFPQPKGRDRACDGSAGGLQATFHARFALPGVHPSAGLLCLLLLSACNPALNWREIRIKDSALVAMLPCKPDAGARTVPLGGRDVSMHMTGCDAGGATFAVAHATVDAASAAPTVLAQWRRATLANMAALSSRDLPLNAATTAVLGSAAAAPMRVAAEGHRKDGSAVAMQGLWFAKDAQVFHAVVYAERISPDVSEAVETFFSGLKFQ